MSKLFPALICVLVLPFATILAAEPKPGAQTEAASSHSPVSSNHDKTDQVVEHLLKAAEHLEAAGFVDESARFREDARQRAVGDDALSRKEAELECLQEEVDRLRALSGQIPTVAIEIVVIEVDRGKLGLRARDFDKMVGFAQTASAVVPASQIGQATATQRLQGKSGIVEANPLQLPLFRDLREKGAIEVLAHPTVQTVTRRPTSILVGGEIPIRVKSPTGEFSLQRKRVGTEIEIVAVVLPNQRVRLQACVELVKISGDSVVGDDGSIHPHLSSRRLNTEVEMQLGQTLAVGRWISDRADDAASVETVVFVTPRLVHGADCPRTLPATPAASESDANAANFPEDLTPTDWDLFGPVVPVLKRRTTGRE